MLHVRKLAEGFIQRGFHFKEISNPAELTHLSPCDVVYISNHFTCDLSHRSFQGLLWRKLLPQLASCSAQVILWNFHTLNDWSQLENLGAKVLHLGEDLYGEAVDQEPVLSAFRRRFNVLPLRYSSPLHPAYNSLIDLPKQWDFNFVGAGYQQEITRHCENKYKSFIRNTPPPISEAERLTSFRRSEVNLAFHATSNIRKGIVVERFPEALSLGGLIFHDHPRIAKEFSGLDSVIQVSSISQLDEAYDRLRSWSPKHRSEQRQASLDAWKRSGLSYFDQAERILAAMPRGV